MERRPVRAIKNGVVSAVIQAHDPGRDIEFRNLHTAH
jgi:hypothetical protein